ncbi:hypothetical protein P9A28_gp18 [Sphingomonas phage Eidolon]|uniref:Virion structural protein n=1 Tax=Sphingomonas phage Eidolon TaxID=2686311 RepID=A0A6M3T857_9CAUD|nr:hypothetical protein P9A28_gp18 [Sphingomonas phage Eidolon]QJD54404.1 hypothetical protein [Sphingomonas phage Eidolon]
MFWFIALFVGALVLSFALQPKVQTQKPAGLSEITAPIAEEGVEIPVLFGTRDFKGANVVWYGDLKTVAIKSKGGKK